MTLLNLFAQIRLLSKRGRHEYWKTDGLISVMSIGAAKHLVRFHGGKGENQSG